MIYRSFDEFKRVPNNIGTSCYVGRGPTCGVEGRRIGIAFQSHSCLRADRLSLSNAVNNAMAVHAALDTSTACA